MCFRIRDIERLPSNLHRKICLTLRDTYAKLVMPVHTGAMEKCV